ncbi:MAG: hydroxymethylglutaryl-CoA lyase [Gammaproteobacteria bacterium]|nr:hydroxymethylglutaryl-CoA lyase [Gammaproteobacteria bacterium]
MADAKFIQITEVGTRDGFQAESKFISTSEKIQTINALVAAGVPRIEYSSFVSPRAIPQLADAAEVLKGLNHQTGAEFVALIANAKGARRAADAGVKDLVVVVSASESHNKKNVNRSVSESLVGFEEVAMIADDAGITVHGAIATGLGCPFEGDVPLSQIGLIAERFQALGFSGVGLGDTTGMATPVLVRDTCRFLQDKVPDMPISLHFHNTRGIGLCNVMAGLDEGVTRFESSIGGLGGCPFAPGATGNICTEDLVYLLHEMGYETGIDLDALCDVAHGVEQTVGHALPGQVMRAGPRDRLHALGDAQTAHG